METTWFWVTVAEDDKHNAKFESLDAAEEAAKQLASDRPGKTFFVCKATHAACTQTPVAFVKTDDGIPF